jgi:hypothetical protein
VHIETGNSGNTYFMRFVGFIVAIIAIINTIVVGEVIILASIVFVIEATLEVVT